MSWNLNDPIGLLNPLWPMLSKIWICKFTAFDPLFGGSGIGISILREPGSDFCRTREIDLSDFCRTREIDLSDPCRPGDIDLSDTF